MLSLALVAEIFFLVVSWVLMVLVSLFPAALILIVLSALYRIFWKVPLVLRISKVLGTQVLRLLRIITLVILLISAKVLIMMRLAVLEFFSGVISPLVLALSLVLCLRIVALMLHIFIRPGAILTVAVAASVLIILALRLIMLIMLVIV